MDTRPIIAVDAMGGDFGPSVVVPGAIEAARLHDLHVLLVGDTPKIEAELGKLDLAGVQFDIIHADDVKLSSPPNISISPRSCVSVDAGTPYDTYSPLSSPSCIAS